MTTFKAPLPSVRRVITGHTADGKSKVMLDEIQSPRYLGANAVHDVAWTDHVPVKSEVAGGEFVDQVALHDSDLLSKTGAVFRSFDYPPGLVVVSALYWLIC